MSELRKIPLLLLIFLLPALWAAGCNSQSLQQTVITFPASAVGAEREVLEKQLERFQQEHPDIKVKLQVIPDAANQKHQLLVLWLNAGASQPDVLQLDVIWTPEFAAAGWLLPLNGFSPDTSDFFPATVKANTWKKKLYALPWFVDVGMLYYRTDLADGPPKSFTQLTEMARDALKKGGKSDALRYGFVWQGARYEGLVCVFLEHLHGFGGQIMDEDGKVVVDSQEAVKALTYMHASIWENRIAPEAVLNWQEEPARFAFQNGQAVFLRNWPYAYPLMNNTEDSKVGSAFKVASMPASANGKPAATLGGSQLAINANSRFPEAAYKVVEYLTQPKQMRERAALVGQFPPRRSLYKDKKKPLKVPIPPEQVEVIIANAVPRPVTPVYSELSEILQIWLHRCLTRQVEPRAALQSAAAEMRQTLKRVRLSNE